MFLLSLKLLLDEDSQAKGLLNLLREAGHDVVTVNEVGLTSKPDSVVLDYAREQGRVLLSRNCDDFNNLHNADPNHPGILVIYQNSDRSKNMNYKTIVKCIANLETSGSSPVNQFIALNPWNY